MDKTLKTLVWKNGELKQTLWYYIRIPFSKIRWFFRCLYRSLIWAKFGWDNYDWDGDYLIKTIKFKLDLLEKGLKRDLDFGGKEKTLKQIHTCFLLCKRLVDDAYGDYYSKKIEEKYGELCFRTEKTEDGSMRVLRRNNETPESREQEFKEIKKLCEYEKRMQQQDKDLLFKIINKHIDSWWV